MRLEVSRERVDSFHRHGRPGPCEDARDAGLLTIIESTQEDHEPLVEIGSLDPAKGIGLVSIRSCFAELGVWPKAPPRIMFPALRSVRGCRLSKRCAPICTLAVNGLPHSKLAVVLSGSRPGWLGPRLNTRAGIASCTPPRSCAPSTDCGREERRGFTVLFPLAQWRWFCHGSGWQQPPPPCSCQ